MASAGYCTQCRRYMWMRSDGSCYAGHFRGLIVQPYEVEAEPPTPAQLGFPEKAPQPIGLIAGASLLCLIFAFSALGLLSLSSSQNGKQLLRALERARSGQPPIERNDPHR